MFMTIESTSVCIRPERGDTAYVLLVAFSTMNF